MSRTRLSRVVALTALVLTGVAGRVSSQPLTYRGFIDARGVTYPQDTPRDPVNFVGDALARGELFARPWSWLSLAAGADLRANSHDQVDDSWSPDIEDRGTLRPRLSIRRLAATLSRGPLTLDVGKQFVRWGKADILTPTDRFAPRDYLNVLDPDFLAVRGMRAVVEVGSNSLDAVWVPLFTPSRLPLLDQRWNAAPSNIELVEASEPSFPEGSQAGIRYGHTGAGYEFSVSFYDGFNNLPIFEQLAFPVPPSPEPAADDPIEVPITRRYPTLRMLGGDAALPTRWFTAKGEIAYFGTSTPLTDEYVLYVIQLERQFGEWVFVGGYAGEVVTRDGLAPTFSPDRGIARTILGRASYTIDVNRSAAVEGAVRQDGAGLYVKGEFSQARGRHWRATVAGAFIRGDEDDFLGQYRLNSNIALALRYSF